MPVIATSRKDLLIVRFSAPEQLETRSSSYDIVCYVRLTPQGTLEINYAHHITRSRETTLGPFTNESKVKMHFDQRLSAMCSLGVYQELWEHFIPAVRPSPGDMGQPPAEIEF